jgi:hypothetical protein
MVTVNKAWLQIVGLDEKEPLDNWQHRIQWVPSLSFFTVQSVNLVVLPPSQP